MQKKWRKARICCFFSKIWQNFCLCSLKYLNFVFPLKFWTKKWKFMQKFFVSSKRKKKKSRKSEQIPLFFKITPFCLAASLWKSFALKNFRPRIRENLNLKLNLNVKVEFECEIERKIERKIEFEGRQPSPPPIRFSSVFDDFCSKIYLVVRLKIFKKIHENFQKFIFYFILRANWQKKSRRLKNKKNLLKLIIEFRPF